MLDPIMHILAAATYNPKNKNKKSSQRCLQMASESLDGKGDKGLSKLEKQANGHFF